MFLPLNTDAPVYHWPWVTVVLIVVNVLLHAAIPLEPFEENPLVLEFGNGLHPQQWVLSAFLHFDWFHLVGNMIFLWVFGLVVEGKLGWWRYLAVYLGIASFGGFLEQLIMLDYQGLLVGGGGASGVVYGLLAMSLVWAPRNDVTCFTMLVLRPIVFEVSIQWFCGFYVALQLAFWWYSEEPMSSELVHLMGAALGFGVATLMLKKGWVDCENWDLFAVMNRTHGRTVGYDPYRHRHVDHEPTPTFSDEPDERESPADRRLRRLRSLLERGDAAGALAEYDSWQRLALGRRLPDADFTALVQGLAEAGADEDVAWLVEDYLEVTPKSVRTLLNLAEILVRSRTRGDLAKRIVAGVEPSRSQLPVEVRERFDELAARLRGRSASSASPKGRQRSSREIVLDPDDEWPFD